MPHLFASKIDNFYKKEEFVFEVSNKRESLVGVEIGNVEFLLSKRIKQEQTLIKYDKISRISDLSLLKNSLNRYIQIYNATITKSNLTNTTQQKQSEFVKNIDYFVEAILPKDIYIEVGFGSGRHLLYQAKQNPNIMIIGIEIYKPSIQQVSKQLKLQNIKNVLLLDYDARLFLELLDSNSVSRIFVHFPVPWDKKPQRRVYSISFINEAKRVLNVGGRLELRSDSDNYYEYVVKTFADMGLDGNIDIYKDKPIAISSKYEDRWIKQNKSIYDVIFTNYDNSKDKNIVVDFNFNTTDIQKVQKLLRKPIVDDGILVHLETLFVGDNIYLIKIALGDVSRPEHKYIIIQNAITRYYQSSPVPTKSNLKAHDIIIKSISG